MKQDWGKNPKFSTGEMQKLMSSPEGKQLFALLSQSGGFQAAMEAFKKGDMKGVQQALQPVMETKEAGELMEKINQK